MPLLDFGDFAPDQPSAMTEVMHRAENVMFQSGAYRPLPTKTNKQEILATGLPVGYESKLLFSTTTSGRDSVFVVVLQNRTVARIFLYQHGRIVEIHNTTDNTAELVPSPIWNAITFNRAIIVASNNNNLLEILYDQPTSGYRLTDSGAGNLIAVVRGRLLQSGDASNPFRVRISALNEVKFNPADSLNPGGFQDIYDTGIITGLTGGEVGHVFTATGIDRFIQTGDALAFQRDKISTQVGVRVGGAAIRVENDHFFMSGSGLKKLNSDGAITEIGHGRIDRFISGELMTRAIFHIRVLKLLVFYFAENILFYNYIEDRFSSATSAAADEIGLRNWSITYEQSVTIADPQFVGKRISDPEYANSRISDIEFKGSGEEQIQAYSLDASRNLVIDEIDVKNNMPMITPAYLETNEIYAKTWLEAEQDERNYHKRDVIPPSNRMFTSEGRLIGAVGDPITGLANQDAQVEIAVSSRDHEYEPPLVFGRGVEILRPNTLASWMASGRYIGFQIKLIGRWDYLKGIEVAISNDGQIAI